MKTIRIKFKPKEISRNELHFNVQRTYKRGVVESKKAYNRKRLPRIEY